MHQRKDIFKDFFYNNFDFAFEVFSFYLAPLLFTINFNIIKMDNVMTKPKFVSF